MPVKIAVTSPELKRLGSLVLPHYLPNPFLYQQFVNSPVVIANQRFPPTRVPSSLQSVGAKRANAYMVEARC